MGAILLFGAALLTAWGGVERLDLTPACPPGVGGGLRDLSPLEGEKTGRGGTEVGGLLESRTSGDFAGGARSGTGIVDQRLVASLRGLTKEHRICRTFKEGHYSSPASLTAHAYPKATARPEVCPIPTTLAGPLMCGG